MPLVISKFVLSSDKQKIYKSLFLETRIIVFVLVQLHLRLSENILSCEFHRHWGFLYITRRHFIVYNSGS